jgi:carbamoyl-phosphate synthase large subunit
MKENNILFTCAGRRNYLINYFKEALKGNGIVLAADSQINAPALIDADIAIKVSDIYSETYIEELIAIIKKYNVKAIISLNDLELPLLSKHKLRIEKFGTKVIISNEHVIKIAFDKWETFKFLKTNKINTPQTYIDIEKVNLDLTLGNLKFPLVLKPRWGSGSIGIEIVENVEELRFGLNLLKLKVKRSILNEASQTDINNSIIIQEKISGVEYGMDILNDFSGKYYDSFAREKISMRSGETDKARSVIDPVLSNIGKKLSNCLGHIGNLDCDIFINSNDVYVLELNPRFGGGYPFSHEAGINTPAIYIEWLNGNDNVNRYNNYKENISFAKCDRLIKIPS